MKPASVNEIKQKLKETDKKELIEICQRLARFKKENKELLTYLLFEEDDLPGYISNVKEEIDEGFLQVNVSNVYFAKKPSEKCYALPISIFVIREAKLLKQKFYYTILPTLKG